LLRVVRSHRGEHFAETRFRESQIRFAAQINICMIWDVTGSFTCGVVSLRDRISGKYSAR